MAAVARGDRADPPAALTVEDCTAAGLAPYGRSYRRSRRGVTFRAYFTPDRRHHALLLAGPEPLLWMDGRSAAVPTGIGGVPCDRRWGPLCDEHVAWLDDRFVHAEVGGLWSHPLYDPVKMDLLGDIRGLLIWDAAKRVRHLQLPAPGEARTSPIPARRGDSWCVYPDGAAYRADRPDRTLPIPR